MADPWSMRPVSFGLLCKADGDFVERFQTGPDKIVEHYIVKDEEADYYDLYPAGPYYLRDSTGQYVRRPSTYPYGSDPWYSGSVSLRGGSFYPSPDLGYMRRLQRRSTRPSRVQKHWDLPTRSAQSYMMLQNYLDFYPGLANKRLY